MGSQSRRKALAQTRGLKKFVATAEMHSWAAVAGRGFARDFADIRTRRRRSQEECWGLANTAHPWTKRHALVNTLSALLAAGCRLL